jgi:hypothetical protein
VPPEQPPNDALAELSALLRHLIAERGTNNSQLERVTGYARQQIARAVAGLQVPSPGLAEALDGALDAAGRVVDLRQRADRERKARRIGFTPNISQSREKDDGDRAAPHKDRPQAIRTVGGTTLGAGMVVFSSLTEGTAPDRRSTMPPHASSQRHIGRLVASSPAHLTEIVAHLREQWHALVRADNLLGPRLAIAGVLNQIAVIEALLSGLRGKHRLELVRLGAQYAESASWLFEDAGDTAQAGHWTSRAMELACEGDDERMISWTVFRRSQQAAAALDVAHAIGFAQAARRNEEALATPTRAAIRAQEAYAHALDGDEQAANRLLDEAHTWAASDTTGDAHEGHGSYCTPSYIEIQRANCWLTAGKPKKAVALYEDSLATLPVVYQRSRAAALSRLATAYLADGQPEQAASAAHAALPVARSGGSMRIVDEVRSVGRDLTRHRKLPAVAALLDDLASDGER